MKRTLHLLLTLILLALASGCSAGGSPRWPEPPQPETWPTQGWQSSTPEAQGMDSDTLARMLESIQAQGTRLHSLVVIRNGTVVLEAYYPPYNPQVAHSVESNTKSVIGALVGIAIQQGLIKDVNQRVLDFFPGRRIQNLDARKQAMTLKDLLSLTAGLDCQDNTPPANGIFASQDWVQFMLDLPMAEKPGTQWRYCSGAVHLLSAILQNVSGMDARSFANQTLFQPLGIPEVSEAGWPADPQGYSIGIAGLHLTPRDLAKFAYLYLHQGAWEGRQVVPAAWVRESTREQAFIGKDPYAGGQDRRFGYLWSIFPQEGYYGYLGMAGQETWVVPGKNMVVVFTAGLPVGEEASLMKLLNDYLLPAAQSDQPLPENPQASARLEERLRQAAGVAQNPPALSQTALDVRGTTYRLDENPFGWQEIAFDFVEGSSESAISVMIAQETYRFAVGLDGLYRETPQPNTSPVAMRGKWLSTGEFEVEHTTLGEYAEMQVVVRFSGEQVELSVTSLNFPGEPTVIAGSAQ